MGYTVSIITDYGWIETCKPLAIGVSKAVAKSIRRHYDKFCSYSDYRQSGTYIMVVNRKYCVNHADFEVDTTYKMM